MGVGGVILLFVQQDRMMRSTCDMASSCVLDATQVQSGIVLSLCRRGWLAAVEASILDGLYSLRSSHLALGIFS